MYLQSHSHKNHHILLNFHISNFSVKILIKIHQTQTSEWHGTQNFSSVISQNFQFLQCDDHKEHINFIRSFIWNFLMCFISIYASHFFHSAHPCGKCISVCSQKLSAENKGKVKNKYVRMWVRYTGILWCAKCHESFLFACSSRNENIVNEGMTFFWLLTMGSLERVESGLSSFLVLLRAVAIFVRFVFWWFFVHKIYFVWWMEVH